MAKEPGEEATIDEALRLMRPTTHVTEPVKAALATELPGIADSVSAIAAMSPLRLAARLIGTQGVAEDDLMDVAGELIAGFRSMLGLDSAAAQASGPLNVTVAMEKTLGQLTPKELLTRLAADPSEFDDIIAALNATRLVQRAGSNPWAVTAPAGTLDVASTLEYLEYLSRPGSIPQRTWPPRGGTRPQTLASVFSREAQLMVNPFTGQQFSGLDEWGNDWTELADADHLAMLWAVATGHRNLPPVPDARRLTDDLFSRRRPAYIREIIEDFAEARRHDPQLAAMSRYFTPEVATGQPLTAGRTQPRRTEADYRQMLLDSAQSHHSSMSGDIRLGATVIRSFKTMSGDVVLYDTIVLDGGSTMSGDLRGTAYVPGGVTISTMSGTVAIDVREKSYEDLARRAGLA